MRELLEFWLFIAFIGMLLLLRFDAHRFGVAEYDDEARHGDWRGWLRRLSFYAFGLAIVLVIYILYPLPISELHLQLGDDRQQALLYGLIFGLAGTVLAFGFAWYRYRRFRLPSARAYPGAIINAVGTAFLDEAIFRGIILGLLLAWGWSPALAIAFETILYGLATRLGAPGRSRAMLLLSLLVGAVGGWLVVQTAGIGAAVLAHAITRLAIFLATGHAGSVRPPGWEPEELASWALPPRGWDIVSDSDEFTHPPQLQGGPTMVPGYRLPSGFVPGQGGPPPGYGGAPPGYGGPPPGWGGPPPGYGGPPPGWGGPPPESGPPPGWGGPPQSYGPPPQYGAAQYGPPDSGSYGPPPGWGGPQDLADTGAFRQGGPGPDPSDPWAVPPTPADGEPRRG
jgi:hypothetical protein